MCIVYGQICLVLLRCMPLDILSYLQRVGFTDAQWQLVSLLCNLQIRLQSVDPKVLQVLSQQLVRCYCCVVYVGVVVNIGLPKVPTFLAILKEDFEPVGILSVDVSCKGVIQIHGVLQLVVSCQ